MSPYSQTRPSGLHADPGSGDSSGQGTVVPPELLPLDVLPPELLDVLAPELLEALDAPELLEVVPPSALPMSPVDCPPHASTMEDPAQARASKARRSRWFMTQYGTAATK